MSVFNENGDLIYTEEYHPYLDTKKDPFLSTKSMDNIHKSIKDMQELIDMSKEDKDKYEKTYKSKRLFINISSAILTVAAVANIATLVIPVPVLSVLAALVTRIFSILMSTITMLYGSSVSNEVIKDVTDCMEKLKEIENNTKDKKLKKLIHDKYEETDKLLDEVYKKAHPFKYKKAVENKNNEE